MIDSGLKLATAEVTPNGGAAPGGLGPASVALGLTHSGLTSWLRTHGDIGGGERLSLSIIVTSTFTAAPFMSTMELQLVSLPIDANLLTNAATSGKTLTKTLVITEHGNDDLAIADHDLPLGTPVFLTSIVGSAGLSENTIYYTIPTGQANKFRLATSLANAITSTFVNFTSSGTATVNFIPTIHASTGTLTVVTAGGAHQPPNQGALVAGVRHVVPLRPLATLTPSLRRPTTQNRHRPIGAGPTAGLIGANAQRFLYLRYVPSDTMTGGAVTVDLVAEANNALNKSPSGVQVID